VRGLLSKLLVATTAEINNCLPWQHISELQKIRLARMWADSRSQTSLLEIQSVDSPVDSSPESVLKLSTSSCLKELDEERVGAEVLEARAVTQ
jgi:hypothetical protein